MATDSETVDGVLMDDDNASYDKAAKRFLSRIWLPSWSTWATRPRNTAC